MNMAKPSKGNGHGCFEKHFYGSVAVGERGQVVIPKEARDTLNIKAGDRLIVLGAGDKNIMLVKADQIKKLAEKILKEVSK